MTVRVQGASRLTDGPGVAVPAPDLGSRSGARSDGLQASLLGERLALDFRYLTPDAYLRLSSRDAVRPFAAILHGEVAASGEGWPEVRSRLRPLDAPAHVEVLVTTSAVDSDAERGFKLAVTEELLFGVCRVEGVRGVRVAEAAESLYRELLGLIERRRYPCLLRMWNILEDVNGQQDGLERYRHFCRGRHEAFAAIQPATLDCPPAACGIGAGEGGLCVYFLAARDPGLPVENPRQISAYRYPRRYGPRSPSFSRGLLKRFDDGAHFFLSGTASITGHESRHHGRISEQVEESLTNVRALIHSTQERSGQSLDLASPTTTLRAYLRNEDHYPVVREIVERQLGSNANVLYLRSDICRRELLFEIDGQIFVPSLRP